MAEKKLGSIKDVPKKGVKKEPFWERIWDYKPWIIVGIIVILGGLVLLLVFRGAFRAGPAGNPSATPSVTATEEQDVGKLIVVTDPPGAVVSVHGQQMKTPATFPRIPEGTYIAVVNMYGYHPLSQSVKVEKGKTSKLELKLEKLSETKAE